MYCVSYEATKENLIFTSSPARMCQGDYKEETFFDKPSLVQVVTYDAVTPDTVFSSPALKCKAMKESTYTISISAQMCKSVKEMNKSPRDR